MGIGSTSLGASNLVIRKAITGATALTSVYANSVVQSDVTNIAVYYGTDVSTQNTTFTLNSLIHYRAAVTGIGASSTVLAQYGYYATSSLIGATNNYGFFGEIASGTGRWNLYMNGTAANYLNGNLLIGSTTDTGEKLQVTGTAKITGASSFGDNLTVSRNNTGSTRVTVSNTTSAGGSIAFFKSTSSNGDLDVGKFSATTTAVKIISANDGFISNSVSGDLSLLNNFSSGKIKFAAGASSTVQWQIETTGQLTANDAIDIAFGTTTGTKIGTATTQKISFWNATPIVQPTTAVAEATFVQNAGNNVTEDSTFDGYTLQQIVKALRNTGLLA